MALRATGVEDAFQHENGCPLDTTSRLRIAARIHFALLRQFGENVAISTLLEDADAAREALWVCDASGNADLVALAKQFRAAPPAMPEIEPAGTVAQDLAWAADTSGFGMSRLPGSAPPTRPAKAAGWLSPSRWLRSGR